MLGIIITVLITLIVAGSLNALVLRRGLRYKTLTKFDQAENKAISKLGGLAIFIAFIISILTFCFRYPYLDSRMASIIGSIILMFLLGFIDDIWELNPWAKLFGQIIIISFLIFSGFRTEIAMLPAGINIAITFLWIIGITNAFNLLDILDGLAAGLTVISSLVFLVIAYITGNILVIIFTASILGATLAFLRFNFPPARIYMGDAGSLFLGFSLAVVAVMLSYATGEHKLALITPIIVLALPILDLTFVIFRRLIKKRSIIRKSKDHFALYLVQKRVSLKIALLIMYAVSGLFGISAILVLMGRETAGIILLFITISAGLVIGYKSRKAHAV